METFITELKQQILFKETTVVGDIVLLASDEPRAVVYALVTRIEPNPGRRRSWWNLTMQVLTVPPVEVVWTLREPQFTGQEIFTFSSIAHFMKAIRLPLTPPPVEKSDSAGAGKEARRRLRVVK